MSLNYKFPLKLRLKKAEEFQEVLKAQQRIFGKYYILCYRKNILDHPRLGLVSSKRNLRLAIKRNLVKRLAREAFRKEQHNLNGIDIVLVAQKSALNAKKKELSRCLKKLLFCLFCLIKSPNASSLVE